jgi:DNA (cytosine-5)-methyltransferase 1
MKLTAISLYSGAGGLDYGFEAAGFETCVAIDSDPDSCETIKANRPWPTINRPIEQIPSREMLKVAGLRVGEAAVLIGGPPCQPFSKSGYWVSGDTLRLRDPRALTLHEYMRCVEETLPKAFLLENVHGISYSGKEEGFRYLREMIERINRRHGTSYSLSWDVLNAADYGVPQIRQRFFLVSHRDGRKFSFPKPTHGPVGAPMFRDLLKPYSTAWDAIGGCKPRRGEDLRVGGYWADLLPSIPEGENYLWHTNRKGGLPLFGWRTRYWSFLLKLAKGRPSWTIQAQPGSAIGPFHWLNRWLSVEEMARIQTFPRSLKFVGRRVSLQRQIGNAVPSLLAEILARELGHQFFGARNRTELRLGVKRRRVIPPPEAVTPVPEKYLALVGDHEDHPGEGRGRRGLRSSEGDREPLIDQLRASLVAESGGEYGNLFPDDSSAKGR